MEDLEFLPEVEAVRHSVSSSRSGFRLYWRVLQQRVRRLRPGRVVGTGSGAVKWKFLTCFKLMASLLCC